MCLLYLFHIKDFVSYKEKLASFPLFSGNFMDHYKVIYAMQWFLALDFLCFKVKGNVKYFFSVWFSDHGLLVKNNQHWKTFQVIYNMTMFKKKVSLRTSYDVVAFCIWRVSHFPCILKPQCFMKNWSVH